ncbi:hypothetical protein I3843_10G050600 [Carya illinoinensis]|nr:hypothetical protein I3843_10G050600 [Carya illinoinensis]
MHQERDGGGPEDMKEEDSKLERMQAENNHQHHPQKCPRCESLNTKFCYYNNYSLSQPRYYCKACRRYWTQGGTLRNVPVGGSCRKGKRTKTSSSAGENSRSQQPPQPQQVQQNFTNPPAIIPSDPVFTPSPALMTTEPGNLASQSGASIHSTGPYYAAGGYLSSLAAIQSLNQPHSFSQALTYARGGLEGSSNLDLLQGRFTVPSFGSQQRQRQVQQRQFYPMGNIDRGMEPLHFTGQTWSQSSRQTNTSSHDWHQSFLINTNARAADTTLWSISTAATATGNANGNNNAASTSNPSQWPNLPGFGPPP